MRQLSIHGTTMPAERILIVDDEEAIREIVFSMLSMAPD